MIAAVAATIAVYAAADRIAARLGRPPLAAPVVWASVAVLAGLVVLDLDVDDYVHDARPLRWALSVATVALGAPLAASLRRLRGRQGARVFLAVLAGGAVASACAALVGAALGAGDDLVAALAAKSVSTPIALALDLPGDVDQGLVASACVLAGAYGAVLLPWFGPRLGLGADRPLGVGSGVVSHAIASAELARRQPGALGWAAAGLAVNGVLTALWLPPVLRWFL